MALMSTYAYIKVSKAFNSNLCNLRLKGALFCFAPVAYEGFCSKFSHQF